MDREIAAAEQRWEQIKQSILILVGFLGVGAFAVLIKFAWPVSVLTTTSAVSPPELTVATVSASQGGVGHKPVSFDPSAIYKVLVVCLALGVAVFLYRPLMEFFMGLQDSSGWALNCTDQNATNLVTKIARRELGKAQGVALLGITMLDSEKSGIDLSAIRTREKKNGKLECAAAIKFSFVFNQGVKGWEPLLRNTPAFNALQNQEITYVVERTDDGGLYVTVLGLEF